MTDRSSPEIFAPVFKYLAKDPTAHAEFARTLWGLSWMYDFWPCELECDNALHRLGLARPNAGSEGETLYWDPCRKVWR